MMKRKIAALLMMSLLFCMTAWAEYAGSMRVVNCQEWVSLREQPNTRAKCLIEVPLGALVENCRQETNVFHYGEYGGFCGYVMSQYLQADLLAQQEATVDEPAEEKTVAEQSAEPEVIFEAEQEAIPVEPVYLGQMTIADTGAWAPMYDEAALDAAIVQWMAPGELLEDSETAGEEFVCAVCRGMKGYVPAQLTEPLKNAPEE